MKLNTILSTENMTEKQLANKILIAIYDKEENEEWEEGVLYNIEQICRDLQLNLSKSKQDKIVIYLIDLGLVKASNYTHTGKPSSLDTVDITSKGKIYVEKIKNKSNTMSEENKSNLATNLGKFVGTVLLVLASGFSVYKCIPPNECEKHTFSGQVLYNDSVLKQNIISINGVSSETTDNGWFEVEGVKVKTNSKIELKIRPSNDKPWKRFLLPIEVFDDDGKCRKVFDNNQLDISVYEDNQVSHIQNQDPILVESTEVSRLNKESTSQTKEIHKEKSSTYIHGTAKDGDIISILFNGEPYSDTAKNGWYKIELPNETYGKPVKISLKRGKQESKTTSRQVSSNPINFTP